jgi:hypothetical protein
MCFTNKKEPKLIVFSHKCKSFSLVVLYQAPSECVFVVELVFFQVLDLSDPSSSVTIESNISISALF